jgi:uncharacterized membrane protein YoaK (UPF0700 family)
VIRYRRVERALAVWLAVLAGFVDAIGFLELGGYFLSFMSGNSTRLGVGFVESWWRVGVPAALIGLFVVGVILGTLAGRAALRRNRRPVVLGLVTLMLLLACVMSALRFAAAAIVAMTLAMGAENAAFEQDGEVTIGLTYMTGTLVKLGQRIADALAGRRQLGWLNYFLLWFGLVAGAGAGAAAHAWLGLDCLWLAAAAAAVGATAAVSLR